MAALLCGAACAQALEVRGTETAMQTAGTAMQAAAGTAAQAAETAAVPPCTGPEEMAARDGGDGAVQAMVHPWTGKRVAYFGDSITDPRNSGSRKKYWQWLQEWLGTVPMVYAVSGRQWDDVPRQAEKLLAEHGQEVDAIVIFMGTNDYNNGVPLGKWYEEREEQVMYGHGKPKRMVDRRRRYMSQDGGTFRGRINIALDMIRRTWPEKQVVLLTPIHRAQFHRNEKNWQSPEDYTNQCGEFLDRYVEAVKEAGNVWSVPVVDLNAVSGLYPLAEEGGRYFADGKTDRLHPNDAGHERLARVLMWQLMAVPGGF